MLPTATLKHRVLHELKELTILTTYLYLALGSMILLKTGVLHTAGVEYSPWGVAIVKALVLAKFILLGNALKIGTRHTKGPLIWPTLYKSFAFLLLLIVLNVLEEIVLGLFHHRPIAASLEQFVGIHLQETIASIVIMMLVLIPWFAFRILDDTLGKGTLAGMFFAEKQPLTRI
jgi:hypothetical protein